MVLYHVFDDPETSFPPCNLGCYVRIGNPARRFHYCDTCETAFHKLNYQESHESLQSRNLSAPLTQMIQNPTSKPSLILEAQQKHHGNIQMHEKLLGHALYCTNDSCGYRTCKLMRVRDLCSFLSCLFLKRSCNLSYRVTSGLNKDHASAAHSPFPRQQTPLESSPAQQKRFILPPRAIIPLETSRIYPHQRRV